MVPTLRLRARQERLRAVVKEVSESRRRVILVVDEVRGAAETAQRPNGSNLMDVENLENLDRILIWKLPSFKAIFIIW